MKFAKAILYFGERRKYFILLYIQYFSTRKGLTLQDEGVCVSVWRGILFPKSHTEGRELHSHCPENLQFACPFKLEHSSLPSGLRQGLSM